MSSKEKSKSENSFVEKHFSKNRQIVVDYLHFAKRKRTVWAFFEVDVTDALQNIEKCKDEKGNSITMTSWITYCVSKAVDQHKIMQAYRKGKDKLIIFDDVDIQLIVEKQLNGRPVPTTYLLRNANEKSLLEINQEVKDAKSNKDKVMVETKKEKSKNPTNKLLKFPSFIRRRIFSHILKDPFLKKKHSGTVGITSIGMFGQGAHGGWGLPITPHVMSFLIGATGRKPGVVGDEIKIRDYLSLSVALDHDLIDGAPATRFLKALFDMMEGSHGLKELLE